MKPFEVPKCFWMPEIVDTDCNCKKVYVDLNIDFEKTRVYMCKDWFVFEIRRIVDENNTNEYKYRHGFYDYDWRYAREDLYRMIINDYIKQPIIESLKTKEISDDRFGNHPNNEFMNYLNVLSPFDIKTGVVICERPYIYESISAIKYIQYVQSIDDFEVRDKHRNGYNEAIGVIFRWLEQKIKYKKYSKYAKIYHSLKNNYNRSEKHYINLNELIIELINITLNKK